MKMIYRTHGMSSQRRPRADGHDFKLVEAKMKTMLCKTLILFFQMFNPQIMKLYCMRSKTMKPLSR